MLDSIPDLGFCVKWTGSFNISGYPVERHNNSILMHRKVYEENYGPIPEGLHIDHLCGNKWCIEPYHLEAVTQAENNRRIRERYVSKNDYLREWRRKNKWKYK